MPMLKKVLKWLAIAIAAIAFIAWFASTSDEPATKGSNASTLIMITYCLWVVGKALDRIENKISQLQNSIYRQNHSD
jgi:conjugal transfer/entry exclusion protein